MVEAGEPLWTDEDRNYVLAWQLEQSHTHLCGQPASESFAKENSFKYGAEPAICHACAALQRVMKQYADQPNADSAGLFARLTRGPHGPI